MLEKCANCVALHAIEDLAGKGVDQQVAGRKGREAACPKIECLVLVELTNGSAVGALDVVRVNLELRTCLGDRVRRE